MSRIVRTALTETRNAYAPMPDTVAELSDLAGRLGAVRDANLDHHEELIRGAVAAGAGAIGLGELFAAPYFALTQNALWHDLAEEIEGPTVSRMRALAKECGIVIVAPFYEIDPPSSRRFNTAAVIDADGRLLGSYRKTHIPHGSNEAGSFDETFYYEASDGAMDNPGVRSTNPYFPVFETAVGQVGVAICYDRHFEGVISSLATGGAELIFCPAVTFGEKSQRLWPSEAAVDAARHGVYIGSSNRRGVEPPWGVEYFGQSYFAGPNGVIPEPSTVDHLIIADLDLDRLTAPDPSGWDLADHRRGDIYGLAPKRQ